MKITESQLRRIIRQEVQALREGSPLSARNRNRVLSSFAYGQLRNQHGAELEQFESEAPDAYEAFLSQLWDLADPELGAGLDGQGFVPELKAAMKAAGVGVGRASRVRTVGAARATRGAGGSRADKLKASLASKMDRKSAREIENQNLATAAMDALASGVSPRDVVDELQNATFVSDGRGSGDDNADGIINLVKAMDADAGKQLAAALRQIKGGADYLRSFDRRS